MKGMTIKNGWPSGKFMSDIVLVSQGIRYRVYSILKL
jgi:hypothetical protein